MLGMIRRNHGDNVADRHYLCQSPHGIGWLMTIQCGRYQTQDCRPIPAIVLEISLSWIHVRSRLKCFQARGHRNNLAALYWQSESFDKEDKSSKPQALQLYPLNPAPGKTYWGVVALSLTTLIMYQVLLSSANAVPRPIEEEPCWLRDDATPHIFLVTQ